MDGDSSSDETTASSGPSTHGFVCTVCFRVFPSGQALGGHQNAHLLERSFRQKTPNILGAVLNHPLPDEDNQSLAWSNSGSRDLMQQPRLITQVDRSKTTKRASGGYPIEGRANCGSSHHHPYGRRAGEEARRRRLTKNLLGERKSGHQVKEGEGTGKSSETSICDPSVDIELSLKSKEYLDLELKLGF
ncbi:hypothetical protein P3X46_004364 [Hevea brasiliensis]|uniref:C2H2-type domain-containing protein n=1 Tax=Hevea brasiliensis TaxID=3981 RepID=A0ABQ9N0E4_HEVBR|nr:zinc finger protein 11-like [Hevea brasiliensis]KAJ9184660.1 hypothetical protein P3X46_004364 [Hevea brasiliensis]